MWLEGWLVRGPVVCVWWLGMWVVLVRVWVSGDGLSPTCAVTCIAQACKHMYVQCHYTCTMRRIMVLHSKVRTHTHTHRHTNKQTNTHTVLTMHVPVRISTSSVGTQCALQSTAPLLCVWSVAIAASARKGVRLSVSCAHIRQRLSSVTFC